MKPSYQIATVSERKVTRQNKLRTILYIAMQRLQCQPINENLHLRLFKNRFLLNS